MNNFDYKNMTPFKWFVLENFPFIENDFDAINNYHLFSKVVEYLNQTIDNMNLTGTQMENVTNAMTELQNYVNNYFDNLEVQEEINNKLNDMVEDGTMNELIAPYLDIFTNLLNVEVGDLQNQINNMSIIEKLRIKNNTFNPFVLPEISNIDFFKQIPIYYNGSKFITDFDVSSLKNISNHTYYVSPSGNDENDGLTENTPFFSLQKAYTTANHLDTIICLEGVYHRNNLIYVENRAIKKSLNIIGKGNVVFCESDSLNWELNSTYNIYEATRSNVLQVIDFRNIQKGITTRLEYKNSILDCANSENSWYTDNNKVYVHLANNEEPLNDFISCTLKTNLPTLHINEQVIDCLVYLENIKIVDAHTSNLLCRRNNTFKCTLVAKECYFYNQYWDRAADTDAVSIQGANAIFQRCKAYYSNKDGFNYHKYMDNVTNAIEIDCSAGYNGYQRITENYAASNGSTAHDGTKVLRINGIYHNSRGPNVADVQNNTMSVNLGCIAYDNILKDDLPENCDFFTMQGNAKMYLYNCITENSNSLYQLGAYGETQIYQKNCKFNTKRGNVNNL